MTSATPRLCDAAAGMVGRLGVDACIERFNRQPVVLLGDSAVGGRHWLAGGDEDSPSPRTRHGGEAERRGDVGLEPRPNAWCSR